MPAISKCPKCQAQVTIPDGVDHRAEVRCPLCAVVYPLDEALAELPPALIPVRTDGITAAAADSEAPASGNLITEPFHVPESPQAEGQPTAGEQPGLDIWQKVDAAPRIDTGAGGGATADADTAEAPARADAFAGFELEKSAEEAETRDLGPARRPRKKKQKSALREVVGAIVGGFLGLAIGYYLLNWIGGPRFDFMEIYLPGVQHTKKHWPGGDTGESEKPHDAPKKPAAGKRQPPAPQPKGPEESPPPTANEDDTAGRQPPPAEPPVAQPGPEPGPRPQPLPPDYVGPIDPPGFTSDDLGTALKAAHDAVRGAAPAAPMATETYQKLCRLGHVLAFVEGEAADGRLLSRKQAVDDVLRELESAGGQPDEVGRLAGGLLERPDRHATGILLGGTVRAVASKEGLHGVTVKLPDPYASVTVMSRQPLPLDQDDKVLVLGSVVDKPPENFAGYTGTQPLLIWAGTAVRLVQ